MARVDDDAPVGRVRLVLAAVLFGAGVVGIVLWLAGQGLDRAEKWVSLVVGPMSVALTTVGLVLGWLTWRQQRAASGTPPVTAGGPGAVAVGRDSQGEIEVNVSGVSAGRGRLGWLMWVAVGLAACVLGVLLMRAGLENADRWASVIGMFLNLAGLAVTVYSTVRARRATVSVAATGSPGPGGGKVDNRISRGEFVGPVVMGRDLEQVSTTGVSVPATNPPPSPPPAGDVSNAIDGGRFSGPVVMGRDLRGIVLPPPGGRPDNDGTTQ